MGLKEDSNKVKARVCHIITTLRCKFSFTNTTGTQYCNLKGLVQFNATQVNATKHNLNSASHKIKAMNNYYEFSHSNACSNLNTVFI